METDEPNDQNDMYMPPRKFLSIISTIVIVASVVELRRCTAESENKRAQALRRTGTPGRKRATSVVYEVVRAP